MNNYTLKRIILIILNLFIIIILLYYFFCLFYYDYFILNNVLEFNSYNINYSFTENNSKSDVLDVTENNTQKEYNNNKKLITKIAVYTLLIAYLASNFPYNLLYVFSEIFEIPDFYAIDINPTPMDDKQIFLAFLRLGMWELLVVAFQLIHEENDINDEEDEKE